MSIPLHDNSFITITAEKITYYPYHVNRNVQIMYVLNGSIKASWVSGVQNITMNEIEIINFNEPLELEALTDDNLVLFFKFGVAFAKQYCEDIDRCIYNCNCSLFFSSSANIRNQELLKKKLRDLYIAYIQGADRSVLMEKCKDIILFMQMHFNDVKNMFSNIPNSDLHTERFLRINTYLIENLDKRISLREIADIEHLSLQYLSKEFSEKLERSFQTILDYYRMKKAVYSLITSNLPVVIISEQCGFSAVRYLYKHFADYMGFTPSKFREKMKTKYLVKKSYDIENASIKEKILSLSEEYAFANSYEKIVVDLLGKEKQNRNDFAVHVKRKITEIRAFLTGENDKDTKDLTLDCNEAYDTNIYAAMLISRFLKGEDILSSVKIKDGDKGKFLSGQKGITTHNKIKKPSYWALYFLSQLEENIISIGRNFMVTNTEEKYYIILVNSPEGYVCPTTEARDKASLYGKLEFLILLENSNMPIAIREERIDTKHPSLLKHWDAVGKRNIWDAHELERIEQDSNPQLRFDFLLPEEKEIRVILDPFSFALIVLSKIQ